MNNILTSSLREERRGPSPCRTMGVCSTGYYRGMILLRWTMESRPGGNFMTASLDGVQPRICLGELGARFAVTVHKAQGSEYRAVIPGRTLKDLAPLHDDPGGACTPPSPGAIKPVHRVWDGRWPRGRDGVQTTARARLVTSRSPCPPWRASWSGAHENTRPLGHKIP